MVAAAAGAPTRPGWFARWSRRAFRQAPDDHRELRLTHSRIYILPTRRGLAVIATIVTMLVTSLNYGLALGFAVAFLTCGLCAAALLHTFRNLAGLAIRPGPVGEAFAGGSVPFALALVGNGRARTSVALATRDAAPAPVDVDAEGATLVAIDVPAPARGIVALGRVTVSSDYPLGLWRGWGYAHFPLEGLAYPAPEPGAPPLPAASGQADEPGAGRQDDGDLAGLRTYQRGDPLQRVAWKTVARGRGWYTKSFDRSGGGGEVTLAFAALPASLGTERRLERLSAWVLACEHAARPFALVLPDRRLAAGQGRDHRRHALAALALHGIR